MATYTAHYNGVAGPLFNPAVGIEAYSDPTDGMIVDVDLHPSCSNSGRHHFAKLGIFFPGSDIRVANIADGSSHTLAIGERNMGETAWIAGLSNRFSWPCDTAGFKNVEYAINLCREDNPETEQHCAVYGNSRPFSSYHPGGAHFAYADGSVHFLSESTSLTVLQAMASREFGETVEVPQ